MTVLSNSLPKDHLPNKSHTLLPPYLKLYQSFRVIDFDVTCPPVRIRKCFHPEEYIYIHGSGAEVGGFWENRPMDWEIDGGTGNL